MISYVLLFCSALAIYRIAESDGDSPQLWGGITFGLGFLLNLFMASFFAAPLAFVLAFLLMFALRFRS